LFLLGVEDSIGCRRQRFSYYFYFRRLHRVLKLRCIQLLSEFQTIRLFVIYESNLDKHRIG